MSNGLRNSRIVLRCKSVFQEAVISHRVLMRLIGLIVLALLAPMVMLSQATQLGFSNSPPSFGHGHDYIQQFNETVNPADGSLTLRIGVPTPPGRGLNFPYALTYNSSSIHGFYQPPPPGPGQGGPMLMQWAYPSFIATTAQGWSDTLPRLVAQHTPYFEGYTNPYGDQSIYTVTCEGWQGLQFTDLSGQVHQPNLSASFTYDESTGCNTATPGTYSMAADGTVQGYVQVGGFADFATPDGTHYEYGLSSDLPSGTFVFFPLLIEDKNGNELTIGNATLGTTGYTSLATCGSPCTISPLTVTDTLGRTVISLQPVDPHHESLSVSGIPNPYTITFASGAGSTGTAIPQASYNYATGSTANTIPAMPALSGGVSLLGLPDGGSYSFSYDPVFGNVNKVTYPNGGYVSYTWGFPSGYSDNATYKAPYIACEGGCSSYNPASQQVYVQYSMPVILSRTVSFDGQNTALSQTFNYQTTFRPGDMIDGWISKTTTVTTNDLVAGTTSSVIYSYSPFSEMAQNPTQRYTGQTAQEYQAVYKDGNGNVLQTVCKSWIGDADLLYTQTTILPNGMVSEHVFSYGGIGAGYGYVDVPNGDDYYDFSAPQSNPTCANPQVSLVEPAPGPLLTSTRQNLTTATTSLYPYGPSIVNTPSSTITKDGSGNTVAETDYQYTNAIAQTVSGVVQHDAAFDNSSQVRQNLLSTTKQCFPSCTSVTTTYSYDNTGQVVSATDGRGNTTNYSYADAYTGNAGQPSSVTNAYVTTVTAPSTLGAQHIQRATYGFNDGKIRSLTDENSNVTTFCYWTSGCSGSAYDPWMRLTQIQYPDGGSKSATYNDAGSSPTVVSSTVLNSSSTLVQTAIGDGMGHVIHSQTNSDPEGPTTVDTVYGGTGAVFSTSNPYRSTGDPSYGVTSYTYDGLGRKIIQRQPDGSMLQWCYNGIASSSAQTICSANMSSIPNSTWVDAADESGHHSQQVTDGAGRLVAVMEPDPGTNVPNLETDYGYDPLGNLKAVTQHGRSGEVARTRSFTYDSLSRLVTSTNPETGTVCYGQLNGTSCVNGYDANGNLTTKTDANGVIQYYSYDQLNRLGRVSSSDASISSSFNYDNPGTGANGVGRLFSATMNRTGQSPTTSNITYTYDTMGRVQTSTSLGYDSGTPGLFTAGYDLAGNLTSLQYPDGFTVSQTWDSAGRLSSINQGALGGSGTAYFNATAYLPSGALQSATLGNGVTESTVLNSRLQPCNMSASSPALPANANGGNLLNRQLFYSSQMSSPCGNESGNNGNIWAITDNLQAVLSQGFSYDALNRLTTASASGGGYNHTYNYDSFGNMQLHDNMNPNSAIAYTVDPATNRLLRSHNGGTSYSDFTYDNAGNLTQTADGISSPIHYQYNAQNQVLNISGGASASYLYDAEGNRVYKQNSSGTTDYVYFNGQPFAEKDQHGSWTDYVYAGGSRIARVANPSTGQSVTVRFTNDSCSACINAPPYEDRNMYVSALTVNGNAASLSGASYDVAGCNSTQGTVGVLLCTGKMTVGVASVPQTLSVTAYGSPDYGVYPHMEVLVGDVVVGEFDVTATAQTYTVSTTVTVQFTNDSCSACSNQPPYQDRNLFVNALTVNGVAANLSSATYDSACNQNGTLACTGSMTATVPALGPVQVTAYGSPDVGVYPQMMVSVNGVLGGTWFVTGSSQGYDVNSGTEVAGTQIHYYLADHLGTVQMELDNSGNLLWQGQFTPFGQEIVNGSSYNFFGQQPGDGSTNHYKFTGKERDTESGLDYFGARYFGSSMGRMMSPDPMMASAKVWDPQTWNRYSYARNNPLKFIDPTGMAEVTAAACAKDKACVTVNVNVIYDKNSNGGKGLTDQQKSGFEKNQLQNAKDQYGNADIHLNVTYSAGGWADGKISGTQAGALNVLVTDQLVGPAVSGMLSNGNAISVISANGAKSDDLPHEMAHQFMGDTHGTEANLQHADPTGILHIIDTAAEDITNDTGRFIMNHVTPHLPNYPSGAPMSIFNPQARQFQNFITPQTKPQ